MKRQTPNKQTHPVKLHCHQLYSQSNSNSYLVQPDQYIRLPPPPPPLKMLSLPTTTQETSTTFSMPKGIYNLLLACLGACQCPFSACPVGERIPSLSCHRPGWSPVIRCVICTEWSQHKASVVVHTSSDTDMATTLVCTVKGWWRWWWNQSS